MPTIQVTWARPDDAIKRAPDRVQMYLVDVERALDEARRERDALKALCQRFVNAGAETGLLVQAASAYGVVPLPDVPMTDPMLEDGEA